MLNKRGQGLSVNAIILIVLGIAVLALMIFGFTMGWNKVLPFLGGDTVDDIVDDCNTACLATQQYNFCVRVRELKVDGVAFAEVFQPTETFYTQDIVITGGNSAFNAATVTDAGALTTAFSSGDPLFDAFGKLQTSESTTIREYQPAFDISILFYQAHGRNRLHRIFPVNLVPIFYEPYMLHPQSFLQFVLLFPTVACISFSSLSFNLVPL